MIVPLAPSQDISLQDWLKILHNAARVPAGHPRYGEARQVTQMALANIRGMNKEANLMDQLEPGTRGPPSTTLSQKVRDAQVGLGVGALHGASLGIGKPIAGLLSLVQGKGFQAGEQSYQEGLGNVRSAEPVSTTVGNVAGAVLSPAARVLPAPTTATRAAFGGGVLGGIQGFMEGEGSPGERLPTAGVGAAAGALGGAVLGKLVKKLSPLIANVVNRVKRTAPPGTPAPQVLASQEIAAETAVRTKLTKDGYPPHIIEQLIRTMKAGKQIPTAPGPEVPINTRPGETLVQKAPREFEVHGTRATPPAPQGGSFWEQLYGTPVRDLGKGKTLPYYPRGGRVEQTIAPFPQTSPSTPAPDQTAIFLEYLKGATPQDLPSRVGTLRDLGIPMPPNAEAEIFQLLFGGPR